MIKRTYELPSPVQRLWRFKDKVGFWHDAYFTDEEIIEMKKKYPEVKWNET